MAFIPIGDDKLRNADPPYVTMALIALNVLVFFAIQPSIPAATSIEALPEVVRSFYDRWAYVPAEVVNGQDLHAFLSAMFLHGSVLHLGSNMLYLWIFGDNVEHAMGHGRFLVFYLLTGIAASAAQTWFFPGSEVWNLGASGAIAGVLGAYLLLFPQSMVRLLIVFYFLRVTRISATIAIAGWFVLQLLSGFSQLATAGMGESGGVAFWAHIGGFVAGMALTKPFSRPEPVEEMRSLAAEYRR